jgi:hypothetical protein
MSKFTELEKTAILIFGFANACVGVYGARLEITGEYEKMGFLFFPWILAQTPANLLALLILPMCNGSITAYYFLTFCWWLLLGSFLGFMIVFFKEYFKSNYIE